MHQAQLPSLPTGPFTTLLDPWISLIQSLYSDLLVMRSSRIAFQELSKVSSCFLKSHTGGRSLKADTVLMQHDTENETANSTSVHSSLGGSLLRYHRVVSSVLYAIITTKQRREEDAA